MWTHSLCISQICILGLHAEYLFHSFFHLSYRIGSFTVQIILAVTAPSMNIVVAHRAYLRTERYKTNTNEYIYRQVRL